LLSIDPAERVTSASEASPTAEPNGANEVVSTASFEYEAVPKMYL
jgi:hypothetical protein